MLHLDIIKVAEYRFLAERWKFTTLMQGNGVRETPFLFFYGHSQIFILLSKRTLSFLERYNLLLFLEGI